MEIFFLKPPQLNKCGKAQWLINFDVYDVKVLASPLLKALVISAILTWEANLEYDGVVWNSQVFIKRAHLWYESILCEIIINFCLEVRCKLNFFFQEQPWWMEPIFYDQMHTSNELYNSQRRWRRLEEEISIALYWRITETSAIGLQLLPSLPSTFHHHHQCGQ